MLNTPQKPFSHAQRYSLVHMMKQNMRGERDEGSRARRASENAELPNAVSQCERHARVRLDFQHSSPLLSRAGPRTHPPTQRGRARAVSSPPSQACRLEPRPLEPGCLEPGCLEPRPLKPRCLEPRSLEPIRLEPRRLEPRSLEPIRLEPRPLEPGCLEPALSSPAVSSPTLSSPSVSSPALSSPALKPGPLDPRHLEPSRLEPAVSTLSRARPHTHAPSRARALSHSAPSLPGPRRLACAPFAASLVPPDRPPRAVSYALSPSCRILRARGNKTYYTT